MKRFSLFAAATSCFFAIACTAHARSAYDGSWDLVFLTKRGASVSVQDKYAFGSGRLSGDEGRGTWSGYVGNARCSGYWTAQRN